jgi:L-seryl-tRNA(Ser) seleniumtransferase
MRQSNAKLVEVGTTNRTRLRDYEQAITPDTALLVKIHRSNFAQVGFTEDVPASELCALGRARGIPVYEDLGSGNLVPLSAPGLTPEPTVKASVDAGVDLVSFSGDKLLGGPQAGVVVGRPDLIGRIKSHPLNRAVRVDKMTVAAMEATLELYRDGRLLDVPAYRLLTQGGDELRARAERLRERLRAAGVEAQVVRTVGQVGGGAMPLAAPESWACALTQGEPQAMQERLRGAEPPVIARIADGKLLLDVRCLADEELEPVARAVRTLREA